MLHHGRARERASERSCRVTSVGEGAGGVSQSLPLIISLRGNTCAQTFSIRLLCFPEGETRLGAQPGFQPAATLTREIPFLGSFRFRFRKKNYFSTHIWKSPPTLVSWTTQHPLCSPLSPSPNRPLCSDRPIRVRLPDGLAERSKVCR